MGGIDNYRAEFEVEFITPAFIRGADSRRVELREASIKGAMRWWFRALAGNYFGNNYYNLKKEEFRIFGSPGIKSKVNLKIVNVKGSPASLISGRSTGKKGEKCGINRDSKVNTLAYLWFPIKVSGSKCEILYYWPNGTCFVIEITSHDKEAFVKVLGSLWALVNLGGLGFRSRRGAGSMKFVNVEFDHVDEFKNINFIPRSIEDFKKSLFSLVEIFGVRLFSEEPSYPVLNQRYSCVELLVGFKDPIIALKEFQERYEKFRRRIPLSNRVIFGLPIIQKRSKRSGRLPIVLEKFKKSRRASPMLVGAMEIGKETFGVRIVKFKTKPFHSNPSINKIADWNVIGNFDKSLSTKKIFGGDFCV